MADETRVTPTRETRVTLETLEDLIRIPPFHQYLGVEVLHAEIGRAVLRIPPKEEFVGNPLIPAIHGGIVSALVDLAGGAALFVEIQWPTPTIDMRIDFLKPAIAGRSIVADARVKQSGKTVAFVDVDVWEGDATHSHPLPPKGGSSAKGKLVSTARCVYSVKHRGADSSEQAFPIG
ncbi:MAG: PaaI family thioesterase [Thermoplasmatota archaeon]